VGELLGLCLYCSVLHQVLVTGVWSAGGVMARREGKYIVRSLRISTVLKALHNIFSGYIVLMKSFDAIREKPPLLTLVEQNFRIDCR
jgi:hypothetical protein